MIINFKKNIEWEDVFLITLDKDRQVIRKEKLSLTNNLSTIELNEEKEKFFYFTNGEKESEIIIVSNLIDGVELVYTEKTKRITCNYFIKDHEDYGTITTFKVKDRKNLSFKFNKSKIINIYTPSNYSYEKEYGLIIMFDSQNIFDVKKFGPYTTKEDPYGGWQVEATLENCSKKYNDDYIVVGIEDADKYRMKELMQNEKSVPFKNEYIKELEVKRSYAKNFSLDKFGNFIMDTVLPYIFKHYKIKKYNIGICGSSCGGNASLYLGMKYSNIFRFIFTLTPAIGFYKDEELTKFFESNLDKDLPQPEIYYFQGLHCDLEKLLAKSNKDLISDLEKAGIDKENIVYYEEPTADHNENPWRYVFNYFMDLHAKKAKEY